MRRVQLGVQHRHRVPGVLRHQAFLDAALMPPWPCLVRRQGSWGRGAQVGWGCHGKIPQTALLMWRCLAKWSPAVPPARRRLPLTRRQKPHISITSRSSSSLLVSLASTRVCFLRPSTPLLLTVFEGASGRGPGCPGLEGTTQSFREGNPET